MTRQMRLFAKQQRQTIPSWLLAGAVGTLLLLGILFMDHKNRNADTTLPSVKTLEVTSVHVMAEETIEGAAVTKCGNINSAKSVWILLHGARFTRTEWNVILPQLSHPTPPYMLSTSPHHKTGRT